jgi:hypothetical protein
MRSIRTLQLVAVIALAAPAARLVAQQQTAAPAKTGKGEITGVVVDSLNLRYLRGADVIIEGVEATLVTDSAGRFKIGGLPPGTYQVGVFHPLLDTLGIAVSSQPFHLGPDSTSIVILSIPPAATLIHRACPPGPPDQGNSAVIGHVKDPETLRPVAGAEVSIAWTEVEVSRQVGLRQTAHVLRDTTNEAGAFHICGVPSSMDATLQARKAQTATSEIPISLGDAGSQLFARTLLLSHTDTLAIVGNVSASGNGIVSGDASVSGTVVLERSPPSGGTRVELVGTDAVVLTNDKGEFTMNKLPPGSRLLIARHLGYAAQTAPVDLTPRQPQRVTITLPKFVALMDRVLVTARLSASLDRVGFNERKKRSGSGYFFGPEQLQSFHPTYLTDILRHLPGVRVTGSTRTVEISSSRGVNSMSSVACTQYFLDDMPWQSTMPGDINDFVNGSEIVAAEVYQGAQAPPQYSRGLGNCTTIVLWTRFKIPEVTEK